MSRSKVGAVAAFEFLFTVKRKGYLFATFGMPLILLAYGALITGISSFFRSQEAANVRVYGVIDRAAVLDLEHDERRSRLPDELTTALELTGGSEALGPVVQLGTAIFRPYPSPEDAHAALLAKVVAGYFIVPQDWRESGAVDAFYRDGIDLNIGDVRDALGELLFDKILAAAVDPELADRVRTPIARTVSWTVRADGEIVERQAGAVILGLVVPLGFTMLLFIAVMMTAGYLVQGTAVEKENKVVEVLLSSANPDQILAGKLLGLGAAGLLQILVWFSMVFAAGLLFAGVLAALGADLPWAAMAAGIPFFVAAYLLFGALMLAAGSLGSNAKEAQQYSSAFAMLAAIPVFFMPILLQDPHSTVARVLTWVPFSSAVTIELRLALDAAGVGWYEVVGPFLVLCAAIWLALRLGGRLFRVGLLLSGSRPKLREILRQARLSSS